MYIVYTCIMHNTCLYICIHVYTHYGYYTEMVVELVKAKANLDV